MRLLGDLQAHFGASLTACELVSDSRSRPGSSSIFPGHTPPSRQARGPVVELSGSGDDEALHEALTAFLSAALEDLAISDVVLAQSGEQTKRLWALRENIGEAQKIEGLSIKHDVSLPISRIPEFVERADRALSQAFPGIRIVTFGHVGDGNLHYNQSKSEPARTRLSWPHSRKSIRSCTTWSMKWAAASVPNTASDS